MTSKCKICQRNLRDSGLRPDRPVTEPVVIDAGNVEDFLASMDVPARYVCPSCGATYCCDCLADPKVKLGFGEPAKLLCPDCNARVRLG